MKKLRGIHRKTQYEIAEELCITPEHYGRIERGQVKTTLDILNKIIVSYGVEPGYFFEKPCSDSPEQIIEDINIILSKCDKEQLKDILNVIKIIIK